MIPYRFYIQQIHFDGEEYTKGAIIDTYTAYGAVCKSFSEIVMPEPKAHVTQNWPGDDGLEVYAPNVTPMKEFDTEAEFIIKGSLSNGAVIFSGRE